MQIKFDCTADRTGSITVYRGGVFRVRIAPKSKSTVLSALERYHYLENPPEDDSAEITEKGNAVRIRTEKGTLTLRKDSGCLTLENAAGKVLLAQESLDLAGQTAEAVFSVGKEDDFTGFGDVSREEYFHRGRKISCWIQNVKSYICVPFFMSTEGYGLLLNSTHKSLFDMCSTDPDKIGITDGSGIWDVYLFLGADFKELLTAYTSVTGRPALPPIWSFGLWHICNDIVNAKDTLDDAVHYRELGIPCDVIGLEPGWMETCYDYSTKKTWHPERFPMMREAYKFRKRTFIDALKYGLGYHFELWLCDNYDLTYEEERRRGKNDCIRESEVITDTEEFDQHLGRDSRQDRITIPEEPWFEHLKSFVDWGADFFKTDGASQVNNHPDRYCGNGMNDAECHNFYPLMLMRQMWEGFAEYTNRRPVIFNPCGWTTYQKWAGTWTGDTGGGPGTLCGMFNTCFTGHGLTTNDMSANTVEGVHFGYLLPMSQINNYSCWKMPWVWGPKFVELHRYYSSLRSRLIPYLYSCMRKATCDGIPMLLPLSMEFPEDLNCRKLKNEYLLGPSLLVSIYTQEGYFPGGEWKDYWTGKYIAGGQTQPISWPEGRGGGLFVREGAIIPFGPVMQYRAEREVDEVELYLYPGTEPTSFEYYEDDGISFDYLKGEYALTAIRMECKDGKTVISLEPGAKSKVKKWSAVIACKQAPRRIVSQGKNIDFTWDEARQEVKLGFLPAGETFMEL